MFLMGPLAQAKKMFEKGRIIATCLYFGAMFLTLWMAIKVLTPTYVDHSRAAPSHSIKCAVYHLHAVCTIMLCDDQHLCKVVSRLCLHGCGHSTLHHQQGQHCIVITSTPLQMHSAL